MTRLSVNLNKVALLRNQRDLDYPSVTGFAQIAIDAGADGITVHPRPDQRHIRFSDVDDLTRLVCDQDVEFNIEGNPFPDFLELVSRAAPEQVTLVPDSPDQSTSDHGWTLIEDGKSSEAARRLKDVIAGLKEDGARVSLFMDAEPEQVSEAAAIGADRVELYTEPWASAFGTSEQERVLARFAEAARVAQDAGLGINAGHDLTLENLPEFLRIPGVLEVSIGHALTSDALELGFSAAVRAYLKITRADSALSG